MDFRSLIPPLTPRDYREDRREDCESRRSFLKHHYYHNPWRMWALVLEYLTLVVVWAVGGHLKNLAQLLKILALIPKFSNGLIGVSLTDSLPALASN